MSTLEGIEREIKHIAQDVGVVKKELLGDGDSEKSVVTRLTRLEDSVTSCQRAAAERDKRLAKAAENREKKILNNRKDMALSRRSKGIIIAAFITALASIVVSIINGFNQSQR